MKIILDDTEYSYVAATKVITLAAPYTGLSLGQIVKITNLETRAVYYDAAAISKFQISISGADITHTYADASDADTDELQIIIDVGALNAGTTSTNAQFTNSNRTNPENAQVLDAENLQAVTIVGAGTAIDVSIYDFISVYVDATSVTTGGVFTFQSSPQAAATDALWATVASTGSNDTSAETQPIAADGMFMFEIDVRKMHYFRPNLTTRTDGTYTVTVVG